MPSLLPDFQFLDAKECNVFVVDVESVKSALAAEYTEQLAELERRLNDARREHTKAGRWRHQSVPRMHCQTCQFSLWQAVVPFGLSTYTLYSP